MNRRVLLVFGSVIILPASVLIAVANLCTPNNNAEDVGAFGSSVTPMDHDPSDTFVPRVMLDGNWLGSAGTGGSIVSGGITLPSRWQPGLTATVKWERCESYGKNCRWSEKVVPIHPYEHVGHTDLHILDDDQVLIIPTVLDPEHPDYPGPGYPAKDFFRKTTNE